MPVTWDISEIGERYMNSSGLINRIGIVGVGALGSALAEGIIKSKVHPANRLFLFDQDISRMQAFPDCHHCTTAFEATYNTEVTFLCVKPQDVLTALEGARLRNKILVTMAAGLTCEDLRRNIKYCDRVLRVMSNLALKDLEAATAYEVPNNLEPFELESILRIFRACGTVEAVREADMDIATALNGSGPAYFTYFVKSLVDGAAAEGMAADTAMRLTLQTMKSSIALIANGTDSPAEILNKVSSARGTTEAALSVFRRRSVDAAIEKAVSAATERARELSVELHRLAEASPEKSKK